MSDQWALLSGLFEGDGSWSLVNGGPSVIIEFGTVSDQLADGVMRLLGERRDRRVSIASAARAKSTEGHTLDPDRRAPIRSSARSRSSPSVIVLA